MKMSVFTNHIWRHALTRSTPVVLLRHSPPAAQMWKFWNEIEGRKWLVSLRTDIFTPKVLYFWPLTFDDFKIHWHLGKASWSISYSIRLEDNICYTCTYIMPVVICCWGQARWNCKQSVVKTRPRWVVSIARLTLFETKIYCVFIVCSFHLYAVCSKKGYYFIRFNFT